MHGGAIDPNINATKALNCVPCECLDILGRGGVRWDSQCPNTVLATLFCGFIQCCFAAGCKNHIATSTGKLTSRCPSDTTGCAGDDYHGAFESDLRFHAYSLRMKRWAIPAFPYSRDWSALFGHFPT